MSSKQPPPIGYRVVRYVAVHPPVTAFAQQVTGPPMRVSPSFEGEVEVQPGDWLVRDDLPVRSLSVWPADRFERDFDLLEEAPA